MDTPWGRRVSHTVSVATMILTLSSDPSSRKIVSRAYILYCPKFRLWIHVRVPECPVLDGVTLDLISGTSPIFLAVGIPNLVCGYILGLQMSHTVYTSLCLIYENLLSLKGILSIHDTIHDFAQ